MRGLRVAGIASTLVLAFTGSAGADTIKVQNTHDSGNGSLREALDNATDGDTVKVPKGRYELSSGQLLVDARVRIQGAGARKTIVDANRESRVFEVDGSLGTVRFTGLTIREGDTDGTASGGGIDASFGTKLVLSKVGVLKNRVITNTSFNNGGGIHSNDEVVLRQSLIAKNHGYNGGGVAGNPTRAIDTTFFKNFGGNPTFNGDGGASDSSIALIDSTVVGNACFNGDGCGGAFFGSLATLRGTIVAGNIAYEANGEPPGSPGNPGEPDNCGDDATGSQGHNLDDRHDCDLAAASDISGKNPRLGKLKNNGGPTNTLGLNASSPAFNAGAKKCTKRDQRGVRRPQGRRCDIGAYERD
jgi:hypothetical protein